MSDLANNTADTPVAYDIIQQEHRHLSLVLEGMHKVVIQAAHTEAAFKLFRAMLFYITEFPERIHHPKEDQFLFAKIKARTDKFDASIKALSEQHHHGAFLAHGLQHALLRFEFSGVSAFPEFKRLVEQYVLFYQSHIRTEEELILPAALEVLNQQDWDEINQAFLENRKMLDDAGQRYQYEQIFSMITDATLLG